MMKKIFDDLSKELYNPLYKELDNAKYTEFTFKFEMVEKDGKWLDETPGIWAKAVGINGNRAAVIDWNETNPEGWESDQSPELKMYSDIILYELHHRDFSIDPNSGIEHKGNFLL